MLAKEKDIWLAFAFFCVVCQIWNLNFYVSYFLCLLPRQSHPLRVSFLAQFSFAYFFFIELWQSSVCWWQRGCQLAGEVQGRLEVARDSPEIVNFCLLLLDFYLLLGDGNGYVRLLFKKLQLLPLSESHVTPRKRLPLTALAKPIWNIIELLCTHSMETIRSSLRNGGSQSERCSRKFKFKQWMELVVNIKDGSCRE